jgi:hypothetical protein
MNVSRLIVFLPGLGRSADDIDELHAPLQNEPGVGELGVRKFPSVSRWSELGRMDTRCQTLADACRRYLCVRAGGKGRQHHPGRAQRRRL